MEAATFNDARNVGTRPFCALHQQPKSRGRGVRHQSSGRIAASNIPGLWLREKFCGESKRGVWPHTHSPLHNIVHRWRPADSRRRIVLQTLEVTHQPPSRWCRHVSTPPPRGAFQGKVSPLHASCVWPQLFSVSAVVLPRKRFLKPLRLPVDAAQNRVDSLSLKPPARHTPCFPPLVHDAGDLALFDPGCQSRCAWDAQFDQALVKSNFALKESRGRVCLVWGERVWDRGGWCCGTAVTVGAR
jgi:hypothetical protein